MDALTCPRCGVEMRARRTGSAVVHECPERHGVFLSRADLGSLVEAENDWHRLSVHDTAQLPRITSDMTAPPSMPRPRAWVETIFD